MGNLDKYILQLDKLNQNSNLRTIKNISYKEGKYIFADGRKMLNLSSNDYLNLSTDKDLALEFIDRYKNDCEFLFSSASARLLTGNSKCYGALEEKFKKMYKKTGALLFNTGYQANQGVVSSLFSKGDLILSDKLNHNSIVSGLKLSSAEHIRYNHNDYSHLEKILKEKRNNFNNAIIISESVFSMDGDVTDIKKLVELKEKYNCLLMIDEAHAFCVFADDLTGVSGSLNLIDKIDIITVTLGKALASMGAMVVADKAIIDYLINKAASFIFSTAIPSVNILWSNFLLNEKFEYLINKKEKLNCLIKDVHILYPTISQSQIIPVVLKDAKKTSDFAKNMQNQGFYVLPINPPTVPLNTSRLRISLTSDIKKDELAKLFIEAKNAI